MPSGEVKIPLPSPVATNRPLPYAMLRNPTVAGSVDQFTPSVEVITVPLPELKAINFPLPKPTPEKTWGLAPGHDCHSTPSAEDKTNPLPTATKVPLPYVTS